MELAKISPPPSGLRLVGSERTDGRADGWPDSQTDGLMDALELLPSDGLAAAQSAPASQSVRPAASGPLASWVLAKRDCAHGLLQIGSRLSSIVDLPAICDLQSGCKSLHPLLIQQMQACTPTWLCRRIGGGGERGAALRVRVPAWLAGARRELQPFIWFPPQAPALSGAGREWRQ